MDRITLQELIREGENARVEFKRDDIRPEQLAKEMVALLNARGGHIILGVEDDGTVAGLTRGAQKAEEWVMETGRTHVQPSTAPAWNVVNWDEDILVGIISLPMHAPDKSYKARRGSAWVTLVRTGSTVRDATNREEMRLYQQSGQLKYERKPVIGSSWRDLDRARLENYFKDMRRQDCPASNDHEDWTRWLVNTGLLVEMEGLTVPNTNIGSMLLFGSRPHFFLSQTGINASAYTGLQKEYDARARASLKAPIVSLYAVPEEGIAPSFQEGSSTFSDYVSLPHTGVIEQALDFVRRNTDMQAYIDRSGQRQERWSYPDDAVREAVVNAVAHRDYAYAEQDIELTLYADRLEIISPGRLPNAMTVEKMRAGHRTTRNELILNVLRDYRYVEAAGLGVPRKIIAGMRNHNGTEPDLIEEDDRFIVRLWQAPHDQ